MVIKTLVVKFLASCAVQYKADPDAVKHNPFAANTLASPINRNLRLRFGMAEDP